MSTSSSAGFRRVISKKRNALPTLLYEADGLIKTDWSTLNSEELKRASIQIDRCQSQLTATLDIINENGKKWNRLIDSIDDPTKQSEAQSEMSDYFADTEQDILQSVESIHDEISSRFSSLTGCITSINRMLEYSVAVTASPTAVQYSQPTQSQYVSHIPLPSLPNLTLPSYDGKGCWASFWNTFSEIIDKRTDLGDSTKLRYLEGTLTGEASDLLSHLKQRDCDYKQIVKSLEEEFKSTMKTQNQVLKEFSTLKPKSESIDDQLKVIRAFETLVSQLKGMNVDPDNNIFCLHNVLERLSPYCQKFIHIKIRESKDDSLCLSDALKELKLKMKDELELRELCPKKSKANSSSDTPVIPVNAQNTPSKGKFSKTVKQEIGEKISHVHTTSTVSSDKKVAGTAQKCIFCGEHPNPLTCWKLSQKEKIAMLKEQCRCMKCFQQGHPAEKCPTPDCDLCEEKHNFSVCYSFRYSPRPFTTKSFVPKEYHPKPFVNDKSTDSSPVPITVATSSDRIRMLTGTVTVSNPHSGYTDKVDVFLDSGAAVSLISSLTREKLALPTVRVEYLNLSGLAGMGNGPKQYDIVQISLYTKHGPILVDAVVHSEPITGSIPMATLSPIIVYLKLCNRNLLINPGTMNN